MNMSESLTSSYRFAKQVVMEKGYGGEISWQSRVDLRTLEEPDFLQEIAWVILSSGMKVSIVSQRFPLVSRCFFDWVSSHKIVIHRQSCSTKALRIYNNPAKISAIVSAARRVNSIGFDELAEQIRLSPLETLTEFEFIGPITYFHLAKNIGLDVAKPDRHLVRIATACGYSDVQDLCREISRRTGDRISVVDMVLWRFATIEPFYLNLFREKECEGVIREDCVTA